MFLQKLQSLKILNQKPVVTLNYYLKLFSLCIHVVKVTKGLVKGVT